MWTGLRQWIGRPIRRFIKSPDGATAVEFAIVAFPFIYVLGTICETGLMLFTEYAMQNAVQQAAREIRTGQVTDGSGTTKKTAAEFKTEICKQITSLIDCAGKVTVYTNSSTTFASLTAAIADPLSIGEQADGTYTSTVYTPGGAKASGVVIATYDWKFAFPFMSFLGNVLDHNRRRLYGISIYRQENHT